MSVKEITLTIANWESYVASWCAQDPVIIVEGKKVMSNKEWVEERMRHRCQVQYEKGTRQRKINEAIIDDNMVTVKTATNRVVP